MTEQIDITALAGPELAHLFAGTPAVTEDQLIRLASSLLRGHGVPFAIFQRGDLVTDDLGGIADGQEDAVADALWADRRSALKNLCDPTPAQWQAINDAMIESADALGLAE